MGPQLFGSDRAAATGAVAVWLAIAIPIAWLFRDVETYMDEIFHVPQAQRYCRGDYSWDPKITTLPGLYLFSSFVRTLLKPFGGPSACSVSFLRGINLALGAASVGVVCLLLCRNPSMPRDVAAVHALAVGPSTQIITACITHLSLSLYSQGFTHLIFSSAFYIIRTSAQFFSFY